MQVLGGHGHGGDLSRRMGRRSVLLPAVVLSKDATDCEDGDALFEEATFCGEARVDI